MAKAIVKRETKQIPARDPDVDTFLLRVEAPTQGRDRRRAADHTRRQSENPRRHQMEFDELLYHGLVRHGQLALS